MGKTNLEAAHSIAQQIGQITLLFSTAEYALDECILDIYIAQEKIARQIDKEIPRMLSRKIAFLRRCFSQIDVLNSGHLDKESNLEILEQMVGLADHRNFLVHGSPAPINLGPHQLKMRAIRYEKNAPYCEERTYAWRDVLDIYMSCGTVCSCAIFLAAFVRMNLIKRSANSE